MNRTHAMTKASDPLKLCWERRRARCRVFSPAEEAACQKDDTSLGYNILWSNIIVIATPCYAAPNGSINSGGPGEREGGGGGESWYLAPRRAQQIGAELFHPTARKERKTPAYVWNP